MGRQRTINDQNFWRCPKLQDSTTEDKIAALHLLTCPDSNVIGGYSLVPRIAAAEIGWTPEQWRQILERLKRQGFAWFDSALSFVWVKNWWDHHSPSQTLGPKLRSQTLQQILQLPDFCREEFLTDFRKRISADHRKWLDAELKNQNELSAGSSEYGIDTISATSPDNCNSTHSSILNTTTTDVGALGHVDISRIPHLHRTEITNALEKALENGVVKANLQEVVNVLALKFESKKPPKSAGGLTYFLAQRLETTPLNISESDALSEAVEKLRGRCFAWPANNPVNYARVGEFGEFELYKVESGQFLMRIGYLKNFDLLGAVETKHAREISLAELNEITGVGAS